MKRIEDLKGMTQEELIVMVQNLQEDCEKKNADSLFWYNEAQKAKTKYNEFKNVIKGFISLAE